MRWTPAVRLTSALIWRTAKTRGPDTPTLVSSRRATAGDGGKKADHRGERGISRKPLRAGMSGVFRWLAVNTRVHTCYHSAHEAAGASGARQSPRPLFGEGGYFFQSLGRSGAAGRERMFRNWRPEFSYRCRACGGDRTSSKPARRVQSEASGARGPPSRVPDAVRRSSRCSAEPGPSILFVAAMGPRSAAHRKGAAQHPGARGEHGTT
jgi:hypothetical protein